MGTAALPALDEVLSSGSGSRTCATTAPTKYVDPCWQFTYFVSAGLETPTSILMMSGVIMSCI